MKLSELLAHVPGVRCPAGADPEISAVVCDSRRCVPGALFVALAGHREDGAAYVSDALARGAAAVIAANPLELDVPQALAEDPRAALATAAAAFYSFPAKKLGVLGITGTSGKTTTAYLLRHLLRVCGKPCGMLGTVEYDLGAGELIPSPLTTPESVDFQQYLAQMRDNGADYCVTEVSSHALCQSRVGACPFAGAVFTNLSREHLDYHNTMEEYAQAKKRLFDVLDAHAVAVVNLDDPQGELMLRDCAGLRIGYGRSKNAQYRIGNVESAAGGTQIELHLGCGGSRKIFSPLVGEFNVYNAVAALALAAEIGLGLHAAAIALESFPGVPGRLEGIRAPNYQVFVDYAHKPDALTKVLQVLRPVTRGRLIAVFGCGGDRDRGKRSVMGKAACELADVVFVTSDNPRTEDPTVIIDEIMAGCAGYEKKVTREADRRKAIHLALKHAGEGDVVLIAGKGHEDYQIVGREKIHFDDREVVREYLGQKRGGAFSCA